MPAIIELKPPILKYGIKLVPLMLLGVILFDLTTRDNIGVSLDFLVARTWGLSSLLWLLPVLVLMLTNWSLEALKWKALVSPSYPISFLQAFKATLSGVSFAMTTPNRFGDFIGKVMHLPAAIRKKAAVWSFYGSYGQGLVTLVMGWVGWLYFGNMIVADHTVVKGISVAGLMIIAVFSYLYFLTGMIKRFPEKWKKYFSGYPANKVKLKIIGLSFLRYLDFATQFYMLIRFFGPAPGYVTVFFKVTLFYLITSLIPATFWGEIGIKESVAVWVFSGLIYNSLIIVAVTLMLWMINLIIPAIAGNYFLLRPVSGKVK